MNLLRLAILASLAGVGATPAFAQTASAPQLDEMVVTANRMATPIDNTVTSVEVITQQDIEHQGTADLVTLLRDVAGVDVARTGGLGSQTSIFMRGGNSNHVLVLVDGVRVASTNTSRYGFENMPLAQIERIEIIRGPRAALWGSDAVGGVIQIFTKQTQGFSGSISLGAFQTKGIQAGFGGGDAWKYGVHATYMDVDGFSAQNERGFSYDPDNDGMTQRAVKGFLVGAVGDNRFGLHALSMKLDNEFDKGDSTSKQNVLRGYWAATFSEQWRHELSASMYRDTLTTPAFFSEFKTSREQIQWQNDFTVAHGVVQFGLDWLNEYGHSRSTFGEGSTKFDKSRRNTAVYAGWLGQHGNTHLDASLRYDDNENFGGHTTFSLGVGHELGEGQLIRASFGQGFRAPNFNELYSPGFGGRYQGNPNLNPETSNNWELGYRNTQWLDRLELSFFNNRIDNLVAFAGVDSAAINIRKARIKGVELSGDERFGDWAANFSATYQHPENVDFGSDLLRRPRRKASVGVDRYWSDANYVGVQLFAAGEANDFGAKLKPYGTLDIRAGWQLTDDWQLKGRIGNLFDKTYYLANGYNTPGRNVMVTLSYGIQ